MLKQFAIFIFSLLFIFACNESKKVRLGRKNAVLSSIDSLSIDKTCASKKSNTFLDIDMDGLYVKEKEFSRRDNLQKIFKVNKLDKHQYRQFLEDSKEYYDFSDIRNRQKYFTISKETDSTSQLQYLVFKISEYEYVIANCTDTSLVPAVVTRQTKMSKKKRKQSTSNSVFFHPIQIAYYEKNIDTVQIRFAAKIQKSIYKTFKEHHLDHKLIEKLSNSLGGKISLNKLRRGDTLQFIYNQLSINGQFLDYGQVKALCIKTKKRKIYALDYFLKDDSSYQYVDADGKYFKTAFLKSPLQKGGNIVSRYNLHRFHPLLQVEKAHLGTDFAAPKGAPVIATASGIVEVAQFTQNNGNYVKIRHDKIYETQYLHMCRFAKGIRNGVRVSKGQVIGYVGSTGLATGPHVCYRFWKRGVQVDPLREKLNVLKQISKSHIESYMRHFASVKNALDAIHLR